jgi:hypothetical protein
MTIHNGDTIRLKATFYTFAGVLSNPTTVTCKVYNTNKNIMATLTPVYSSVGVYYADYTTAIEGMFTYEFSGTLEGSTILSRGSFTVSW